MARFGMDKANLKKIERILLLLRRHLPELHERYKVKSLGVFGSYVRGEQRKRSDLDVLVDWRETPGLLEWVGLQDHLSELLGVKVDLVPCDSLKPRIGKRILEEVVWLMRDGALVPISERTLQQRRQAMNPKREFVDFLEDIVKAMEQVERFVAGMSLDQFITDDKTIFAVTRAIEIIGEAVKHIPASIRRKYPDIPWKKMAGARDRIIHGYFDVKLNVVWEIATQQIPTVKPLLMQALEKEKKKTSRDEHKEELSHGTFRD